MFVRVLFSLVFLQSNWIEGIQVTKKCREMESAKQVESIRYLWREEDLQAALEAEFFHFPENILVEVI